MSLPTGLELICCSDAAAADRRDVFNGARNWHASERRRCGGACRGKLESKQGNKDEGRVVLGSERRCPLKMTQTRSESLMIRYYAFYCPAWITGFFIRITKGTSRSLGNVNTSLRDFSTVLSNFWDENKKCRWNSSRASVKSHSFLHRMYSRLLSLSLSVKRHGWKPVNCHKNNGTVSRCQALALRAAELHHPLTPRVLQCKW